MNVRERLMRCVAVARRWKQSIYAAFADVRRHLRLLWTKPEPINGRRRRGVNINGVSLRDCRYVMFTN
jgi:hypothetical protein